MSNQHPQKERSLRQSLREFKQYWRHYVVQSALAAFFVFIVLMTLSIDRGAVLVASIGATTFVVFAMPNNITARPKAIIGGHLAGLACGLTIALLSRRLFINHVAAQMFWYAIAVGLTMFVMVVFDIEHAPAAATAMGVVITGFSWHIILTVVVSAALLALIHAVFRPYLKDLT